MKIYVATSWRNPRQPAVIALLRKRGYDVYDFRNPEAGNYGFHWSQIDLEFDSWTPSQYREALKHPLADKNFGVDMSAMESSDVCLLLQPCGIDANAELGWFVGAGKKTVVLLAGGRPGLMIKMADHLCVDLDEVFQCLEVMKVGELR